MGVGNVLGAYSVAPAGTYSLVTDASTLEAGDVIIIVNSTTAGPAISTTQNSNNRGASDVTVSNSKITLTGSNTVQGITLEIGNKSGTFAFNTGEGYLYAASSSSNYLRTEATKTNNSSWSISISSGSATVTAQGSNTRNILKYNANTGNGNPIFSCYNTTGTVAIFKKAASCTSITPTLYYSTDSIGIDGTSSSPTLTGNTGGGTVTYSISPASGVATINSSTGVVTGTGTGNVTVTASIAATGSYCSGSATATIKVRRGITYYVGATGYIVGGIDGNTLVSTLPASPTSCDAVNYPYFVGWKNGSIAGSTTTKPTILSTEVVNSTTAENTYYAVFADKTNSTTEYTFTSNDWNATSGGSTANWTSGSAGYAYTEGQGNQITSAKSGANATSPVSFTNVSNVLVTYNTNKSAGAGSVAIKIGSNSEVSNTVGYSSGNGTSSNYTTSFSFSPAQTGNVKLTVNCTTNSIWLKSIAITTGTSGTTTYITTCCSQLGSIKGSFLRTGG